MRREPHGAAGALEKREAELLFIFLDEVADRGRRHAQLLSRARKVQEPAGGMERPQGGGAGDAASHGFFKTSYQMM